MSVVISWANKMQLAKCDIIVGFCKSSHNFAFRSLKIYACIVVTMVTKVKYLLRVTYLPPKEYIMHHTVKTWQVLMVHILP